MWTRDIVRLLLVIFTCGTYLRVSASQVVIDKNGYSNILVGISPEVPEQDGKIIIENIKKLFNATSEVLFNATYKRAYFKHVKILIPQKWTTINVDREATSETFQDSDVRIDVPSKVYGDTPYTVHTRGCGDPGEYTHITPGFIKELEGETAKNYGSPAKVLVHEWAYLRYGVFEEYGYPGDPRYPAFYYNKVYNPDTNDWENVISPNSCVDEPLRGPRIDITTSSHCQLDPVTGLPDDNCRFFPYLDEKNTARSSLMSFSYLESVHLFCDEDVHPHIPEAPNKQNVLCHEQSTWSVISNHQDFVQGSNPPNDDIDDVTPSFTVIQPRNARFVLVLDISGSMDSCKMKVCQDSQKLKTRLYQAARRWIKYDIRKGSSLGIVKFNTGAYTVAELTEITDDQSREDLMSKVPIQSNGGTSIGAGLLEGLTVLKKGGETGGIIILITDGRNTNAPSPGNVMDPIKRQKVRVVSIAFGHNADSTIESLAAETEGKSYFVELDSGIGSLSEAFTGSLTYQPAEVLTERAILLFQEEYRGQFTTAAAVFSVDATTGRDFLFQLDYSTCDHVGSIKLIKPSGETVKVDKNCQTNEGNVVQYKEDLVEIGQWEWGLELSGNAAQYVVVTVTSRARNNETSPIYTQCWLSSGSSSVDTTKTKVSVIADVKQGNDAVIGATVMARIERPDHGNRPYEPIEMQLLDNGNGADVMRHDGIYSRYFTKFTNKGRYSVKCQVQNDKDTYVNLGFIAARRRGRRDVGGVRVQPADPSLPTCCGSVVPTGETNPTGNFTRHASGGSFQVINQVTPDDDLFPPVRVTDLSVIEMSADNGSVTLEWTAPGDDLDQGTALGYIMKYSTSRSDLTPTMFNLSENSTEVNDTMVSTGSLEPLQGGDTQTVTLDVSHVGVNTNLYFALRAYDKKQQSDVSNIAETYIVRVSTPEEEGLSAGAIAGIVIGVIVAVIIIALVIFFVVKKL